MDFLAEFKTNGFTVVPEMISETTIRLVSQRCDTLHNSKAGTRNLLHLDWCQQLAQVVADHPIVNGLLASNSSAVQCTYFEKSIDKNWLVALHRDLFIPVKEKVNSTNWTGWSVKEGINFARPPKEVLDSLIAVRVHLEDNDSDNGPLEVIPGSHIETNIDEPRSACLAPKGGALVVHPLILHVSSKIKVGKRRVLHFLYGPNSLPNSVEWAFKV